MKILHIIPSLSLLQGGPPVFVSDLCRAQAKLGADITLITTDDNGIGRLDVALEQLIKQDDYHIIYFRRTLSTYSFSIPLTRWLLSHIADYDFVHAHAVFRYPPLIAAFLARLKHVPYTITPHGLLLEWGLTHGKTRLKQVSTSLVDIPLLNRASFVHATSIIEQNALETLKLRSPIETVFLGWNPTDDTLAAVGHHPLNGLAIDDDRLKLLYVGRFNSIKGLDLLFPAVRDLVQHGKNLTLLLAGTGEAEYENWMRREIQQLGIQENVHWLGFIDGDDKAYTYLHSDIVVVPSYSESFGLVVLEAMGHGIPLIVSDQVAIHTEVSQAVAGIVVPCEVDALAEAISKLIQDPALRRTMGENGRRITIEQLHIDITASTLLTLYQNYV